MSKKSFWKGFAIGCVLGVITAVVFYVKVVIQPDITLSQIEVYDLEGNKEDLKDYIGKPLVVNIWGTWCAPCRKEFPHFEEVKQEVGEDINFVMISDEKPEKIAEFSRANPYTFTYLRSDKMFSAYGINARPATFLYNAQGELIAKRTGGMEGKTLRKLLEKVR